MGSHREIAPGALIAERVECFWISETTEAIPTYRVLPDGCADVIYTRDPSGSALRFVGPMTRFADVPQQAGAVSVGIRFRPAMWADVCRVVGDQAADLVLPLEEAWSDAAKRLLQQLDDCTRGEQQIGLLAQAVRPAPTRSPFERAIAALEASRGTLALDRLAMMSGLSTRQFRRKCIQATALSPKLLARILRFRHSYAMAALQSASAETASECGYFDQSHLIADFREFAGRTPKRL